MREKHIGKTAHQALLVGILLMLLQFTDLQGKDLPYTPVITPNGSTLPWKMVDGVKEFHLIVEEIDWEMAPGMTIKAWGYNGRTPCPTIETVEGDQVRILVTNKLPEPTAVHWHGVFLPSGMDGVQGLTQPGIRFFIIHPKERKTKIDRDYAIFLNEWFIDPGSYTPDPSVMTEFNIFTFNSRAFPGTEPIIAQTGDRVRVRIANVAQEAHPIHLHGHSFQVVATDGGDIPESAQWPETTVLVAPGQTRDFEFTAVPGDWAMHCHRRHHPMNAMGHDVPNVLGVNQDGLEEKIRELLPNYMAMGEDGMAEMAEMNMQGPINTLPMMAGEGPFGTVAMGGMFTILKVRDDLDEENVGWYPNPPGTVASKVSGGTTEPTQSEQIFVCPMHSEIQQSEPGSCPKCGMNLKPEQQNH